MAVKIDVSGKDEITLDYALKQVLAKLAQPSHPDDLETMNSDILASLSSAMVKHMAADMQMKNNGWDATIFSRYIQHMKFYTQQVADGCVTSCPQMH